MASTASNRREGKRGQRGAPRAVGQRVGRMAEAQFAQRDGELSLGAQFEVAAQVVGLDGGQVAGGRQRPGGRHAHGAAFLAQPGGVQRGGEDGPRFFRVLEHVVRADRHRSRRDHVAAVVVQMQAHDADGDAVRLQRQRERGTRLEAFLQTLHVGPADAQLVQRQFAAQVFHERRERLHGAAPPGGLLDRFGD